MTSVMNPPTKVDGRPGGRPGSRPGGERGLPEAVEVVIGVDTHEGFHVAAAVDAATGGVIATVVVDADEHGYTELVAFADAYSGLRAWAIEGTMSHGAGLTRHLTSRLRAGEELVCEVVYEIDRPARTPRWRGEKTDAGDAVRAAREALARPRLASPKSGGTRAALAVKMTARRTAVQHATDAERQLRSMILTAPETLRTKFRGLTLARTVEVAARLRLTGPMQAVITDPARCDDETLVELAFTIATIRDLAQRAQQLRAEATGHERDLLRLVRAWRPDLLTVQGIGAIVAATVLTAWSHPGRIHSPAAFGMLAGTAPILAASGVIQDRHRLNRHGNRQLNRALHTIVLTRQRHDPATIAYTQRRTSEGKNPREIRRCLKNYIARDLYRLLENPPGPARVDSP